jgi:hypothetical protein
MKVRALLLSLEQVAIDSVLRAGLGCGQCAPAREQDRDEACR